MRDKPAAAAPSFDERFRLPGAAAISSIVFCFSTAKSRRQPFHPVTRAAACGSYPLLFFCRAILQRKSDLPSSIFSCFLPSKSSKSRSVLSRGRLPAARVRRRATMRGCKQTVPDASRIRACGCSFALVTQPEAFLYGLNKRPNAPKNLPTLPAPGPATAASPL